MGVFHLWTLLTIKSHLGGWDFNMAMLSGADHAYVANQAHRLIQSCESWLKALSCFPDHTVSNLHNVLSVRNCCDMGDMSMYYSCTRNQISMDNCLRIVRQAIHQELWTGMKLSLFNVKVETNSLKVKRLKVLTWWELNKYLLITPPLKYLATGKATRMSSVPFPVANKMCSEAFRLLHISCVKNAV